MRGSLNGMGQITCTQNNYVYDWDSFLPRLASMCKWLPIEAAGRTMMSATVRSGQRLNSVSYIFGKLVRVLHHIIIRIRTKLKNCIFYYSYYSRFYLRRYSSYNVSAFHDVHVQNICFLMLMLFLFKNITKKRGLLLFFQAAM